MIQIIRIDSDNKDFIELVKKLDVDLAEKDGDEHPFYAQFNKIDIIKYAVVAYENENPIGCGAIKQYSTDEIEVKRMYVVPEKRGKGIANKILSEIEKWANELDL